ncbi:histone methylation protein DOT1 [Edaphobacter modestus]|uniref:Histone methylation protein DOT1 n=1 Tax=Edaphobacter modestus TaxID=388466 RepID=A0A4Q7YRB8_9BACT|nr:histone methylation protein DOT1 [Edaphobacter modestus]
MSTKGNLELERLTGDASCCSSRPAAYPSSPSEWTFQHVTDVLERLVGQFDSNPLLAEPNQLRQRLEALDRIDAYLPYTPQAVLAAESIDPELYRRARTICDRFEALNCELYEAIRCEIQRGSRPDTLLQWVRPSVDIEDVNGSANDMGYDYLDELISGVFQFEEPDDRHILRDSEKAFYQPTPVRHIFRLMRLTELTATDVLVDLGSGLGHVPLLVSICTQARSIGIELEAAYIERAQQCAQRLNLNKRMFIQKDARVADLSLGTVFYLYTPFRGSILDAVLIRLKREAATRRIRICSYGPCTSVIAEESWLEAATAPEAHGIALFHSRP